MSGTTRVFRMDENKHRIEAEHNGVMYSGVVDLRRKVDPILVQTIRLIGEGGVDIVPNFDDWNSFMIDGLQRTLYQRYLQKRDEVKSHFGDWDGEYVPSYR
jgi:hypothetical protein